MVFALVFLLLPAGVIYVVQHQAWAQKMGVILLCYLSGLLVGNLGLIPKEMAGLQGFVSEAGLGSVAVFR